MEKFVQYVYRKSHLTKTLGTGALLFFAISKDYAQTTPPAKADTTRKLKEVNISNIPDVKTLTPAQQATSSDFIRSSANNVADAIRDFAGVNIKDYGGIGGLKTVSVRSLGADNTLVLYNGLQLNDAQSGEIDLGKFDLNNISSITLYNAQPPDICQTARAFASSSVLSIKTITPQLAATKAYQVMVGIQGGSFGLVEPYLQWQQRLSQHWSMILNGSEEYANGGYQYKPIGTGTDTTATRTNDQVDVQHIDAGLYWTRSDSSKFNLQFNYYHSDRGLPTPNIVTATLPDQYLHNRDYFMQAGYEHIYASSLQFKLNARLSQSYLEFFETPYLNTQGYLDEHYTQREAYQSAVVAYHIFKNWEVSYAVDADVANLQTDIYNYAFPTRLSLFNVLATDITFGKWHLQADLLNTHIQDHVQNGTAAAAQTKTTPTIMATVQPFKTPDFELRTYYKSIYRNPTFAEQYYYAVAPRPLKPEYSQQFNLGASYSKTMSGVVEYVTLSADAYYNNIKDKIIFIPARSPETPSATNLGIVDDRGLDVNLKSKFKLTSTWSALLSASYTYQKALDITDPTDSYYNQQIPYTPVNTVAGNIGLTHQQFGIYYNQVLSSSRYSASDNIATNYLPGYSVSDASVVYHFITQKHPVMVSAEVNNLFNKNYTVISGYPMPGRSFRLSIQLTI